MPNIARRFFKTLPCLLLCVPSCWIVLWSQCSPLIKERGLHWAPNASNISQAPSWGSTVVFSGRRLGKMRCNPGRTQECLPLSRCRGLRNSFTPHDCDILGQCGDRLLYKFGGQFTMAGDGLMDCSKHFCGCITTPRAWTSLQELIGGGITGKTLWPNPNNGSTTSRKHWATLWSTMRSQNICTDGTLILCPVQLILAYKLMSSLCYGAASQLMPKWKQMHTPMLAFYARRRSQPILHGLCMRIADMVA